MTSLSCELYQSSMRQCFQDPTREGCEDLSVVFSKGVAKNAQKHCLFNKDDVLFIRQEGSFQEIEGLKSWKSADILNVEVESEDQVFNCIFKLRDLPGEVYVLLAYELTDWLVKDS